MDEDGEHYVDTSEVPATFIRPSLANLVNRLTEALQEVTASRAYVSPMYCGVNLGSYCLSHGQLYVTKVGSQKNLFVHNEKKLRIVSIVRKPLGKNILSLRYSLHHADESLQHETRTLNGWLRHKSRAFQIAVSLQVKFDEICPAPSLILMFVPSCSIMLIPAPPLLRVRSEDPSVYAVKGRGLAFLIKNLYYEDIAINIPNTLDLEAQEKFWNFKKANMISFENTIIEAAKVSIPRALIIFSMKKINMKKLAYALENTDLNKTPGPDRIHGRMISNLGKIGKERLLNIFNNSWKTGKLPQDCKNATIIPIKKLDKSADDPKNYRPISLTNICCKLMEKIILRQLTYHPDTRNLLPEEQYGFRKGHGTIDQLLFFTQKVKDAQNEKPTNNTIATFYTLHKLLISRDRGEATPGRLCSLTAEERLSCHVVGFLKKLAVITQQLTLDRATRPPSLFLHTHYPWTIQDVVACIHIPFSIDAIRVSLNFKPVETWGGAHVPNYPNEFLGHYLTE
ncbi:hypothetical protein LAZ67_9001356, partial [Cordylochernes scorpioides]